MQPMTTATVLFFAELITELEAAWLTTWKSRRVLVGAFCTATLVMVADYDLRYLPQHSVQQQPDYSAALTRALPP
jgi:transcriptional regulator of nitric oxide reductase